MYRNRAKIDQVTNMFKFLFFFENYNYLYLYVTKRSNQNIKSVHIRLNQTRL